MKRPEVEAAEPWLALAQADSEILGWIVARDDAPAELLGLGCFHGQQAAEKALKAVLAAWDLPAPRSHDLTVLAAAVAPVAAMPEAVLAACEALADYGVGPRYPTPGRQIPRAVALRAQQDAQAIVRWCRGAIG